MFHAEFQMFGWYRPASTRVVGLWLPRRGEITSHFWIYIYICWWYELVFLKSLLWAITQAKGTCEDYNTVLPEASMNSFNHSSPGPTPSSAELEDHPVTSGEFLCSRNPKGKHRVNLNCPGATMFNSSAKLLWHSFYDGSQILFQKFGTEVPTTSRESVVWVIILLRIESLTNSSD